MDRQEHTNSRILKELGKDLSTSTLQGFRGSKEKLFAKKIKNLAGSLIKFFPDEFKYEKANNLKIKGGLTHGDYELFHAEYKEIRKNIKQYFTLQNKKKEKNNEVFGLYLKKQKDRMLNLLYTYAYFE